MMLLLDIGNTTVKWAAREHGVNVSCGSFRHRGEVFDACARAAWCDLQTPVNVVVSNVAGPAMGERLTDWTLRQWAVRPVFIRATDKAFGVTNAYRSPAELGADRWAALIGAHGSAAGALCVADCGTAVTVDFLAADGVHQGGMILPGVAMLQRMLLNNTSDIKILNKPPAVSLFARNTDGALHAGAIYLLAAAIDRIVADMGAAAGTRPEVIITGGDAVPIGSLLACPARHDPDLVLKGLAILAGES